jgi:hypothetical protein
MKIMSYEEFINSNPNVLNETSQQRARNVTQDQVKLSPKGKRITMKMTTIKAILSRSSYVRGESLFLYNIMKEMIAKRI